MKFLFNSNNSIDKEDHNNRTEAETIEQTISPASSKGLFSLWNNLNGFKIHNQSSIVLNFYFTWTMLTKERRIHWLKSKHSNAQHSPLFHGFIHSVCCITGTRIHHRCSTSASATSAVVFPFSHLLTSLVILMNWVAASGYMFLLFRASVLSSVALVAKCGDLE